MFLQNRKDLAKDLLHVSEFKLRTAPARSWLKALKVSMLSDKKAKDESTPNGIGRLLLAWSGRKRPNRSCGVTLTGVFRLYWGVNDYYGPINLQFL